MYDREMQARRVAVIDVGTSSVHMIVGERQGDGYRIVDRDKVMVHLGAGVDARGRLTGEAMERGLAAIGRMAEVARGWSVREIVAVATSAVREATNRDVFVHLVKEETGIDLRILSGEEEAGYIFRAVRSAVELGDRTALCIDIGGGSVELIAGTATEVHLAESHALGSLTLSRRFALEGRPSPDGVEACRRFIRRHIAKVCRRIEHSHPSLFVATSGTVLALARLAAPPQDTPLVVSRELGAGELADLIERLCRTSAAQRVAYFGIEEHRARTIVGGALLLHELMRELGIPSLLACPVAMREGLLERRERTRGDTSLRRKAARALAQRSNSDMRHAEHVARLALRIFDQTTELHGLHDSYREILEHAALLHEIGMHVSDRAYHKHTYYLVRHAELRGFTEEQLVLIANVARYHRKATPADDHQNLDELTPPQRADMEKLASILRIAEALDRGHRQFVHDVAVELKKRVVRFPVQARAEAAAEIAAAGRRAKYFGELFDRRVRVEMR